MDPIVWSGLNNRRRLFFGVRRFVTELCEEFATVTVSEHLSDSSSLGENRKRMRNVLAAVVIAASACMAQVVDGVVVNTVTGVGIAGARITIRPVDPESANRYEATTDANGRVRIEGVEDGVYTVGYRALGFLNEPGMTDPSHWTRIRVSAATGAAHFSGKLQPLPKLFGRVLDGTGKPVPNASIWVLGEQSLCNESTCYPVLKQSKTDEKGEFHIADLIDMGPWLLAATAPPSWEPPESRDGQRMGWATTFYPDATVPEIAARIRAQAGNDLSGLNIRLQAARVHRVSGRVLDATGKPAAKVAMKLMNGFGPSFDQETRDDGTFDFPAVTAANWGLTAIAKVDGVKLWAAEPVNVGREDVDQEIRLLQPMTIHGRVAIQTPDGMPPPENWDAPPVLLLHLTGIPLQEASPIVNGLPDENRNLVFEGVYPGPYRVMILESPKGLYYLDSVRFGARDVTASEFTIASGDQALTVTYKYGGGSVSGTVDGCGSGRVILVPVDPWLRRAGLVRDTNCGGGGQFQINAVRPGEYYGLAISGDSAPRWSASMEGELSRLGARITVRAGERSSAEINVTKW